MPKFLRDFLLLTSSSLLLILAFPKNDLWILSWIALVPLFLICDGKSAKKAFWFSYLAGILFFAGTLYWFVYVTGLGAALIVLYLSVYFGLFGLAYAFFARRDWREKMLVLPSVWVALEFIRSHLMSGFGWVLLGHSQYKNIPLIQIADITGVYGISFLVVMFNVWLKEIVIDRRKINSRPTMIILVLLFATYIYGYVRLNQRFISDQSVSIAVVQGNIPQILKWDRMAWPSIMRKYLILSEEAVQEKPDLIIWPETSFPGFLWEDVEAFKVVQDFVRRVKIPLLVGAVTKESDRYYNSALLLDQNAEVVERYDKLHLVPFGEYVPLRGRFPILTDIIPIDDFTAGNKYTVFPFLHKKAPEQKFCVLICFEDTLPYLARNFAKAGSNLFVNMTNDAWFMDTKEPYLHLQAAIFRSVEHRIPMVRAANTGLSTYIDPHGRIVRYLKNGQGKATFVPGYSVETVFLGRGQTIYTKLGDIFTYYCFGCILWGILKNKINRFSFKSFL